MNRAYQILSKNHLRKTPILATVSGVLTTEPGMIGLFDRTVPSCDLITTKSYQVVQTFGHREPVVCSVKEGDFGNFVGLRNPGMEAVFPLLKEMRERGMRALLNVSLSANRPEDFATLVEKFDPIADLLELNFSCPHAQAGFGASIGSNPETAAEYVRYICKKVPVRRSLLIVKLTPNVPSIAPIARAVTEAGADGIAAINTVGPLEHVDPVSGEVIFNKAEGGKGGASGEWVKEKALEVVREIREAVGDEPILLGMGGVTTAQDVKNMMEAGADSVGIGSALCRLEMKDYEPYFRALKENKDVSGYLIPGNRLAYRAHRVLKTRVVSGDMLELTLTGNLNCKPGQFAFLWIPQIGEKPFSVAGNEPLKFLIKRRGFFTEACFDLREGDTVYTRGLYGKPMNVLSSERALLLAGGSGVAVLPLIAEELKRIGVPMKIKVGTVLAHETEALSEDLSAYGPTEYVADNGTPGRVLETLTEEEVSGDTRVYIVGPGKMMAAAAKRLVQLGCDEAKLHLSMEKLTLCGIGMCGECYCAGKLACKEGTFYTYRELRQAEETL